MARRRRRKNPLLTRILVVSLLAHAIALPIAAHFGAFDKLKQEFGTSRVVMVTVPPDAEKKPVEKAAKKATKTQSSTKRAPSAANRTTSAAKSNLPQPKIVAGAPGEGEGGGPTVDANGAGKAGELPTPPPGGGAPVSPPANTGGEAKSPPTPPVETPKPEAKPENPLPTPVKPEPPKVEPAPKKFVECRATFSPDPVIPDELRTEPLDKTLVVEADVDGDGKPQAVRIAESTGIRALDDAGLEAARRWRFQPATLGDAPVSQHVRFEIAFKVE